MFILSLTLSHTTLGHESDTNGMGPDSVRRAVRRIVVSSGCGPDLKHKPGPTLCSPPGGPLLLGTM